MGTERFRAALGELVSRAGAGEEIAMMCAETLWWRCHRRLIADALTVAAVSVVHLIDARTAHPHRLSPALRLDEDGSLVYDVAPRTRARGLSDSRR